VFFGIYAGHAALYRGYSDQDAPIHYGYLVDGIRSLKLLLQPWGRPLFTAALCIPAQFGFFAARLACCAVSAWGVFETWRLARRVAPDAAFPALLAMGFQAHFFILASQTMTEPMFALMFAVAYRWWLEDRRIPSLLLVSLLPLVRPEGFFLGILWGFFTLAAPLPWKQRLALPFLLLSGTLLWSLLGVVAAGDFLFIPHHWPSNWQAAPVYGTGSPLHYVVRWPLFTGFALLIPFVVGLAAFAAARAPIHAVTFAFLFAVHSALWWRGAFGSIGYLRYFVCIGPLIALISAEGLRLCAALAATVRIPPRAAVAAALLAAAFQSALALESERHVHSFAAWEHFLARHAAHLDPPPAVVADALPRIPLHRRELFRPEPLKSDLATQRAAIAALPPGTRILWDDVIGTGWYSLREPDFRAAGCRVLARSCYDLDDFRAPWARATLGPHPEPFEITLYERE
jgi:hypothetical protein